MMTRKSSLMPKGMYCTYSRQFRIVILVPSTSMPETEECTANSELVGFREGMVPPGFDEFEATGRIILIVRGGGYRIGDRPRRDTRLRARLGRLLRHLR